MKKHYEIRTEIIINASAQTVWNILTDLNAYALWNPFIVRASGIIEKGRHIQVSIKNDSSTFNFKPLILHSIAGQEFEWMGNFIIPGIFDGNHYFRIESMGNNQVNLIHGELFSGILAGFFYRKSGNSTRQNFIAMNQALKERAESFLL
jgi:hypothetical protein